MGWEKPITSKAARWREYAARNAKLLAAGGSSSGGSSGVDNQFVRVRAKRAHANESIYLRRATWLLAKLDDHITTEPLT
jgi:hypothetical protein